MYIWALAVLLMLGGGVALRYFEDDEFRGQKGKLSPELLAKLDEFRARLGYPVRISPADGAMARRQGEDSTSQHNLDRWGEVRAIDVMPTPLDGAGNPRAMTKAEAEEAKRVAEAVGFTGIGVYPGWAPFPGLHLDVRPYSMTGATLPDTWAGVPEPGGGQDYIALDAGFRQWGRYA